MKNLYLYIILLLVVSCKSKNIDNKLITYKQLINDNPNLIHGKGVNGEILLINPFFRKNDTSFISIYVISKDSNLNTYAFSSRANDDMLFTVTFDSIGNIIESEGKRVYVGAERIKNDSLYIYFEIANLITFKNNLSVKLISRNGNEKLLFTDKNIKKPLLYRFKQSSTDSCFRIVSSLSRDDFYKIDTSYFHFPTSLYLNDSKIGENK